MQAQNRIELGADGVFFAFGSGGIYLLMLESRSGRSTWLLAGPGRNDERPPLVGEYADLDEGLAALARLSGLQRKRHHVVLPCGASFLRPGKVPVGEILAAHGYVVAQTIVAYGLIAAPPSADPLVLRRYVERCLAESDVVVGSIDHVGDDGDESSWCFDLTISFEGALRRDLIADVVDAEIGGRGIELTRTIELIPCGEAIANRAKVTPIRPLFQAA